MGKCSLFAAALVLIPSLARAQTSREDGIRALLRGDYQAAARILGPLANNTPQPDPFAQFLMAILYDTGKGVERSMFRACGLFLDAAKPANPLMEQSSQLSNSMLEESGPAASQFCVKGATWPDWPTVTFTLGPNHSIVIKETSITVTYNGTEGRTMTGGLPGLVPLPARYTPLDVTRPVAARRHFIQYFMWVPDAAGGPTSWSLGWGLSEVVGAQLLPVAGERSLVTVAGARPPDSVDTSALAQVRVNANGEAEWIISGSINPRSGLVPWKDPR